MILLVGKTTEMDRKLLNEGVVMIAAILLFAVLCRGDQSLLPSAAGMVDVNSTRGHFLFYMLYEAPWEAAPVVVWLQGRE